MQNTSTRPGYGTCPVASIQHFPIGELAKKGLLLQAAFPLADLDPGLVEPILTSGADLSPFRTLVLLGQAGSTLFESEVKSHLDLANPFDDVVESLVGDWFEQNSPESAWALVYPGEIPLPLGQLAQLAGWGRASPLGLTINPTYGLWLAHRCVFVTDIEWDYHDAAGPHPCDSCVDRPCVAACPAGAVSVTNGFDVKACATHRAPLGSECEFSCRSRDACPVGAEHHYGPVQMKHHYESGLKSVREWLA
jgi:hypothetical protein